MPCDWGSQQSKQQSVPGAPQQTPPQQNSGGRQATQVSPPMPQVSSPWSTSGTHWPSLQQPLGQLRPSQMHVLLTQRWPAGQLETQVPFLQNWHWFKWQQVPSAHCSTFGSRGSQLPWQVPPTHRTPAAHVRPQPPQFFGSVLKSTALHSPPPGPPVQHPLSGGQLRPSQMQVLFSQRLPGSLHQVTQWPA
jgi:hypothetical protein